MDELKVATKGSLMNEIDFYKEENEHLKDLLQQVYEMSFLDDIIDDACRDRKDDEMLAHNLFLKQEIMEALHGKSPFPKRNLVSKLKFSNAKDSFKIKDLQKLNKHNGTTVVADHYSKEDK